MTLENIDVVLLAGGLGSRLRDAVPGRQKVAAEVKGRAFVEHLIDQFAAAGARRIVLAAGHLSEQVKEIACAKSGPSLEIRVAVEDRPLGTAGAILNAAKETESDTIVVANGDSYAALDLPALIDFHRSHGGAMTLALVAREDGGRYGLVETDADGRVTAFREKQPTTGRVHINAGVYVMGRRFLERMKGPTPLSLETDVMPGQACTDVYAQVHNAPFIDIGTPESYAAADQFFDALNGRDSRAGTGPQ